MPKRWILVPLLVLGLAAALWFWKPGVSLEDRLLAADTSECCGRLRQVYSGLVVYSTMNKRPPTGAGQDFLQALITSGTWEDTPENRERFRCPSAGTPYAARDAVTHPLARFPSGGSELEPLAACDGGTRLAHAGCLNVLYSDGSVQTLLLEQEIERGRLPPDATTISIGPDSPIPELQKLVIDEP